MRRLKIFSSIAVCAMISVTSVAPSFAFEYKQDDYGKAKNVIMMIPDGMSIEASTTARWMNDDYTLNLDNMARGLVRTNNSNTPIGDSAPAGASMATGVKTQSPYIATYPKDEGRMPGAEKFDPKKSNMPLATVLEGAERLGKSTGIVATSNVQHATPADFSSHYPDRNKYEILGEQQVYQNMEVVLGGGSKYLDGATREDKEDLISVIKEKGYDYVTDTESLLDSKKDKIWGMFAEDAMDYDIDRDPQKQPSLEEMTRKAIDVLSKNDKGFFLMVEGSKVDWALHSNDPVGVVSDIKAFDKAVKVAKEFADKNPQTVVIVAADHGTGGLTFGEREISRGYDKAPIESFTRYIKNAKKTGEGAAKLLNEDKSNIEKVMSDVYGITDLKAEEIDKIKNAKNGQEAIGQVVAKRSHIGFTSGGHVGGDVALYCYTSGDIKPITGTVHNRDIGRYNAAVLGVDLDTLTDSLYVEAIPAFEKNGAEVKLTGDYPSDKVLTVKKGNMVLELPMYKNEALLNGNKQVLDGLVIYNGEKVYVSQATVDMMK